MTTTTIGGQSSDTIDRWLLDADQYKAELQNVAKMVRDQQKVERDLETVRQALAKQTEKQIQTERELIDVVKKSASEVQGLGTAIGLVSGIVSGGLVVGLEKGIGAVKQLGAALVELAGQAYEWFKETEKDIYLHSQYKEQIEGVQRATRGLIDEETIEQGVRRLAHSERKLQQDELEKLAVASFELAKRQGTSAKEAFDSLIQAYATGAPRGLKELGISLDGINTLVDKQAWLMANLESVAASTNVTIDNPLKERAAQKNYLLSLEKQLSEELYKEKGLAETVHGIERAKFEMEKEWLVFKFQILKQILETVRATAAFDAAIDRALRGGATADALAAIARAESGDARDRGIKIWNNADKPQTMKIPGMEIGGRVPGKGGRGGAKQHSGYSPADAYNGSPDDMLAFGGTPRLNLEGGGLPLMEADQDSMALAAAQITAEQKLTSELWKQQDAVSSAREQWERYQDTIKKASDTIQDLGVGAMSAFGASIWSAADAAIQGQQAFDKAMLMALKSAMYRVATEATAMMFMSLARYAFSWGADAGALTAAGMYAAAAGVAGGIGLGLSAATAGSSSPEASASRTGSSGTYRPSYGTSQERQQQKWVIKVVAGGDDPLLNQALSSAKFRAIAVDDEAN